MTWPLTVLGLTLLLPLIILSWVPDRAMSSKVVLLAPTEVRGSLGDTVTLPCHLQLLELETPRVTQIRWKRLDRLGLSIVAEFHWELGRRILEPDHVEFAAARLGGDLLDASLTIRDLSPGDEANYTCEIQLSTFQMGRASTWLRVFWPSKVVVLAPTEVRGSLGDNMTLPCHLKPLESETPRVTQIRWERLDKLEDLSIVAEFHWERGPSIPEPSHVEFAADRLGGDQLDASLIIHELSPGDEANYTCKIQISTFQMGRASTWLRVFYAPQVSMALYEDIGPQGHRETRLTCDARSNLEPKSYNWSTTTGSLPPFAVPQGSRLLIQPTEESINMTFICRVSDDLGTGQASMNVLLPGSLWKTLHSPAALRIIFPIAGIVFVAVLGALVYFWCLRQSRQDPHSAPDHGAVSYAAEESEACASQDPPTEGAGEQKDPPGDPGAGRSRLEET